MSFFLQPLFPMSYTRILLPVDTSVDSRRAVRLAVRFVMGVTGAAITLVAAVPPGDGPRHPGASCADQALETARVLLQHYGIYSRGVRQPADSLAGALEAEVATHNYDLILVGSCEHAPKNGLLPILILPCGTPCED